jgi:hypothetical protein
MFKGGNSRRRKSSFIANLGYSGYFTCEIWMIKTDYLKKVKKGFKV